MPPAAKACLIKTDPPKNTCSPVELIVIGSGKNEPSHHPIVQQIQDPKSDMSNPKVTMSEPGIPNADKPEADASDTDSIQEIQLNNSIELMQKATDLRNPSYYYQALTFDAEKRALEERANQLEHRLEIELRIKSRKLASRYYGWVDVPWTLPMHGMDLNDMWGALRSSSDHEYPLQDPNISKEFFDNLRHLTANQDILNLQNAWGNGHQIQDYFHEYPAIWKAKDTLLLRYAKKKKRASKARTNDAPTKSIVQKKLEEDIAKKEAELLTELSKNFKANPVPLSSLIPKYKAIMSNKGNKATDIRHKATEKNRVKIQANMSNTVQETLFEINKEDAKVKSIKLTSPTVLDAGNEGRRRRAKLMENEERAGLTTEHTFHPIITKSLPDYKKLQENFISKLEKKKASRPPTVPLPFRMVQIHQEEGQSQKIQRQKEILKEEKEHIEKSKLARVPYYNSIIPPSMMVDQPPGTKAWKLTVEYKKAQEEAREERSKREEEELLAKKTQSKNMASKLRAKLYLHDKQTSERHSDCLQRLRKAQKQREIDHKKELQEMNERINQRLSLFEQSEIASAKEKVKREFKQVLEKAGLKGIEI